MIKKVTIYGERCSGTTYLESVITNNFNIQITWEYGWKHFFGFNDLSNSNDTLFIGIIRDPFNWINSLYKTPFHIPQHIKESPNNFLNSEFYSVDGLPHLNPTIESKEIMADRNLYTKERYKNIFELRYTKLNFLMNDMPKLVKNYIFIRYEDLLEDFENTLNKIKNKGLIVKSDNFPQNICSYKGFNNITFKNTNEELIISKDIIKNNKNFNIDIEKKLKYIEYFKKSLY